LHNVQRATQRAHCIDIVAACDEARDSRTPCAPRECE